MNTVAITLTIILILLIVFKKDIRKLMSKIVNKRLTQTKKDAIDSISKTSELNDTQIVERSNELTSLLKKLTVVIDTKSNFWATERKYFLPAIAITALLVLLQLKRPLNALGVDIIMEVVVFLVSIILPLVIAFVLIALKGMKLDEEMELIGQKAVFIKNQLVDKKDVLEDQLHKIERTAIKKAKEEQLNVINSDSSLSSSDKLLKTEQLKIMWEQRTPEYDDPEIAQLEEKINTLTEVIRGANTILKGIETVRESEAQAREATIKMAEEENRREEQRRRDQVQEESVKAIKEQTEVIKAKARLDEERRGSQGSPNRFR